MRVVVAEDSVLFREGLARVLSEQGHQVVSMVGDAGALVRAVEADRPDLAIIDIRMPPDLDSDGARAAVALRKTYPELGLVLLSQHIELKHALPLIGTPGFGYLLKDRVLDLAGFADSLQRVASGGTSLDPNVMTSQMQTQPRGCPCTGHGPVEAVRARGPVRPRTRSTRTGRPGTLQHLGGRATVAQRPHGRSAHAISVHQARPPRRRVDPPPRASRREVPRSALIGTPPLQNRQLRRGGRAASHRPKMSVNRSLTDPNVPVGRWSCGACWCGIPP